MIKELQLNDNEQIRFFIKEKLRKSYFNNLKCKFDQLPKNKKKFEEQFSEWLDRNFNFGSREKLSSISEDFKGMILLCN